MNTGQMMMGIGALALVVMTVLNFNRTSITTQDNMIYNKEFIVATTVAQSMMDEITSKLYDEEIAEGKVIKDTKDFSSNLQSDGENYLDYDDVDDYNNYSRTDTIPELGNFDINVEVTYMDDNFNKTTSRQYNKNITVMVTTDGLMNFYTEKKDTLFLTSVFSYWKVLM